MNIVEKNLSELRTSVARMMSEKRLRHTLAVENMAERIGKIYAPDKINILRAAALLHDITKEKSLEEQLDLCKKYSIEVNCDDRLSPKTFHAKTAAAVIQFEPQFSNFAADEVISAVRWHTTGRRGMSICEKIIFLSDYIDDSRSFEDCVILRRYFWEQNIENMSENERAAHLRDTMILAYDMTIKGLIEEEKSIAEDTFDARNELICDKLKANKTKG